MPVRPAAPDGGLRVMCLLWPRAFWLGNAHGSFQTFAVSCMTPCSASAEQLRQRTSNWQEAMVPPLFKKAGNTAFLHHLPSRGKEVRLPAPAGPTQLRQNNSTTRQVSH